MAAMICCTAAIQPLALPVHAASVQEAAAPETEWISAGTDIKNLVVYNAANTGSFRMSGRTYTQGIVFTGASNDLETNAVSSVTYDVSAFSTISFTVGHLDNTVLNSGTLTVIKDGTEADSVFLSYNITAREYSLDVSEAESVTFTVTVNGKSQFGFGNISVDGSIPEKPSAAPEYDSPEKLMNAGYNLLNTAVFTAADKSRSFKMNGRTFYQGLRFAGGASYSETNASLFTVNTENVSKLRFTAGHVDNTTRKNATIKLYRDNVHEEAEDIALTPDMALKNCEIDVTDTKCLLLWVERGNDSVYAIGDLEADGKAAAVPCTVPAAGTPEQLLSSVFNTVSVTPYTLNDKSQSFKINGRTYYQGLALTGGPSYNATNTSSFSLNVENYQTLKFTAGHIDNTAMQDATVTVYRDNVIDENAAISLSSTMPLREIQLDVADTGVLRFSVDRGNDSAYAFGDFSADEKECEVKSAAPVYATPEKLLDASFNLENITLCTATDQSQSFKMNGRTFYQGIQFNGGSPFFDPNTSRISFNTENISRLSFTAGHLDNTALRDATLFIFRDNVKSDEETISLSASMPLKDYEIDVTDTGVLTLVMERKSKTDSSNSISGYGFANVAFDGRQGESECKIPKYTDPAQMLKAGFNTQKVSVYSGDDTSRTFSLGSETYTQGIVFGNGTGFSPATENRISFNVENVGAVTMKLGCIQSDGRGDSVMRVLLDNQEIRQIPLTKDMTARECTFNTQGSSVLELIVPVSYTDSYAAAEIRISDTPVILRGDVNGDGTVGVDDAQTVLKAYTERISGKPLPLNDAQAKAGDVDDSGVISIEDAQLILKYYTENTVAGKTVSWDDLMK